MAAAAGVARARADALACVSETVAHLAADPERRRRIGEAARRRSFGRWSPEEHRAGLERLYARALG